MFKGFRYDYILIWGNGLHHEDEILEHICSHPDFDVIHVLNHKPKCISAFVKAVYSFDYAPFEHLEEKTQYLLSTTPKVKLIVFKNINPDEDYLGTGAFRHLESMTVKSFKEKIRNLYNERKNDRRTENHVIHATDNQKQTDYLLRYLGYKDGLNTIVEHSNKYLGSPWHLSKISKFTIKQVCMDELQCRVITGQKCVTCAVEESPHYKSLINKNDIYKEYLKNYQGQYLKDNYSVKKFRNMAYDFKYLSSGHEFDYILVRKKDDKYIVCDGLHRLSILKSQKIEKLLVAVIV